MNDMVEYTQEEREALQYHKAANHRAGTSECRCFDHLPKNVKAWIIHSPELSDLYLRDPVDVVDTLECDAEIEVPVERVEAMQPGDAFDANGDWSVACEMVNRAWLDSLPEFEGL